MDIAPVYTLRVADVYRALETSAEGLPLDEVEARQSLYGSNLLSPPVRVSVWRKFIVHFIHPMALLLWGVGFVAFIAQQPGLGVVIWFVVTINSLFSFWREFRAEQAISALHKLLPAYARLIREGAELSIPASEVVPGDVLVLAEGDNIPADSRVVEEYGLRTNNSTLTGEAVPSRKSADASLREGISELERPNLVFAGTSVVSGTGRAVVYATGMLTQFGRIARLTQQVKEGPSPLQQELVKTTRLLALFALTLGAIVFSVGLTNLKLPPFFAFILGIGAVVATLPEGLPAIVTLSLAAAGQRLASMGVLVKKLSTIEALGNVSIIATDKSGTLTQNQMTVREIWVAGQQFSVSGVGYEPVGEFSPAPANPTQKEDLLTLLTASALSNNARILPPSREKPSWSCLGDQTEAALKVTAFKAGLDEPDLNARYPRVHELPFDARRKRMSTIHRENLNGGQDSPKEIAFIKGAPREVLQLCTSVLINGQTVRLDNARREEIIKANDEYSRSALRVLALAQRELPIRDGGRVSSGGPLYTLERVERDLTFLGLMAMMDPPRPEVARAVKILNQAGIRIIMITGDYGLTAESLARRVGILTTQNSTIVTGAELDQLNDVELQSLIQQEVLFARMAPENKLRLVAAFQALGHVVAVTGDGVNDAPALRKSDIGISMGIIGTDVAKEAADVILTNDNFAAIARAIAEGRAIYDNLRKFITYIFSSNVPEILPFIVTAMSLIKFTWTVLQILAIDLGTDLFPALALGAEKPEPGVMRRPPRRRDRPLIDRDLVFRSFIWLGGIEALLCYSGYIALFGFSGNIELLGLPWLSTIPFPTLLDLPVGTLNLMAATVFFAGVVTAQVGNAFATRTERARGRWLGWTSNRSLLLGVAVEIAIGLILIYSPINRVFGLVPLPAVFWIWLAPYAVIIYSLDWIRKSLVRRLPGPRAGD
jgi:P-type Ca2+ transporter type 2C